MLFVGSDFSLATDHIDHMNPLRAEGNLQKNNSIQTF